MNKAIECSDVQSSGVSENIFMHYPLLQQAIARSWNVPKLMNFFELFNQVLIGNNQAIKHIIDQRQILHKDFINIHIRERAKILQEISIYLILIF